MSLTVTHIHPADVPELVDLHRRAFPSFFLSELGPGFLTQFYRGFLSDPSSVTAIGRDDGGRLVGAVAGTVEPAGFFRRLLLRQLGGFVVASTQAALRDPSWIPRLLAGLTYRGEAGGAVNGALLSSICVDPAAQGGGAGRRILDEWCARAFAQGAKRAFLTTDAMDNDAVQGFYSRNGWRKTHEFTTPEGRRMMRYEKELG